MNLDECSYDLDKNMKVKIVKTDICPGFDI